MVESEKSLVAELERCAEMLAKVWDRTLHEAGIEHAKYIGEAFGNVKATAEILKRVPWE